MKRRICRCSTPVRVQDGNGVEFCDDEGGGCGSMIPSPELEAILAHSRDFKERLDNFGRRIERLEATVARANWNVADSSANGAPRENKLLSATKLASELGVSPQWIRDHWRELGGRRDGGPTYFRYWFDLEHAREEFFAIRGDRDPKPGPATQPPRRRRLNSAPLLPVKGKS